MAVAESFAEFPVLEPSMNAESILDPETAESAHSIWRRVKGTKGADYNEFLILSPQK
jgi:hypothetical protein